MKKEHVARAPISELLAQLPSVDKLLQIDDVKSSINTYGRDEVLRAARHVLQTARESIQTSHLTDGLTENDLVKKIVQVLVSRSKTNMRQVINLTGTVLHTNLGRAIMPPEVVDAIAKAASEPCALEYDLGEGKRGDRDELVEELLCELTGAEAATVVNNNAAAVFLLLNALSNKKETVVSRGELIEIGGAFRIPDIMKRAGAKLVEVGTTNRTHAKDFVEAITPKTSMLMKIHTSNYVVQGFTHAVPEEEIASIAHEHQLPFVVDLGSGTLVDMTQFGLPAEPTPREAIQAGADLVTFSGDKLLGGPQAGILVGRKDLIQKIKKNPLKRVLRVGKITLAGLEAVLRMYRDPAKLPEKLTVMQLLTRDASSIRSQAEIILPKLREHLLAASMNIQMMPVSSQIGSGSLPVERLPSTALAIEGIDKIGEKHVVRLERLLRSADTPVIGRFQDKALIFDLRCLQSHKENQFIDTFLVAVSKLSNKSTSR
jgi:L-seryl-tRNA(Ser) seleniumtransferase